jgi:tetratricopeptide (TPR) repeat protein
MKRIIGMFIIMTCIGIACGNVNEVKQEDSDLSSEESFTAIYKEVKYLGYDHETSVNIAERLLPLYNKFNFTNIHDTNVLYENFKENIDVFARYILDENGNPRFEQFELYALLTDKESANFLLHSFADMDALSDEKALQVRLAFQCNYLSFLTSVILKAKGLDVRGVFTKDMGPAITSTLPWWKKQLFSWGLYKFPFPDNMEHNSCIIRGRDGLSLFVDVINLCVSKPFFLNKKYKKLFEEDDSAFKKVTKDGDLYNKFRIWDENGLYEHLYINLGQVYAIFDLHEKAIYYFQKARALKPDDIEAYYRIAASYKDLGQYDKAIEFLQAIIMGKLYNKRLDSDRVALTYSNLADLFSDMGQHEDAIYHYKMALLLYVDDLSWAAHDYFNLANVYINLKQYNKAIENLENAVAASPAQDILAITYAQLGVVYSLVGQHDKAVKYGEESIKIQPAALTYMNIGLDYYYLRRYARAKENVKRAAELYEQEGNWNKSKEMEEFLRKIP